LEEKRKRDAEKGPIRIVGDRPTKRPRKKKATTMKREQKAGASRPTGKERKKM